MKIFDANKDIISDPNKIYPGQKIRIPLDDQPTRGTIWTLWTC